LPGGLVLDGELVVPDGNGRADFEEVRRRNLLAAVAEDAAARRPSVLVVFDLLEIDDDGLRKLPLFERRERYTLTSSRRQASNS
jgi:ATP-dependent DNA ligase